MTWPTKKLGEITEISSGGTPRTGFAKYWNGNIPWLRSGELIDAAIYDTEKKISERGLKESSAKLFPKNSVLIALTGATVGKTGILKIDSSTNQSVAAILPNEKYFIPEFVWYFLRLNYQKIKARAYGGAQPHIDQGDIKAIKIPLPPLEIQKQIVERLDKIVEAQKLNGELIQKAEELFQSLLYKELNPTGKNWEVKKLGDIIKPQYGYTASAKDSGEYRFIRITDISDKGELKDSDKKYVMLSQNEAENYQLRNGDLLLARTGATFGKILYFKETEPSIFASFLIRLNPDISIDPFYIWLFSRSQSYWRQAKSLMTGSGQPQFNANKLKQIKIPLPPLKIQKQIVEKLSAVQEYKKKLLEQKSLLKELFETVLNKSFKGQL